MLILFNSNSPVLQKRLIDYFRHCRDYKPLLITEITYPIYRTFAPRNSSFTHNHHLILGIKSDCQQNSTPQISATNAQPCKTLGLMVCMIGGRP